MNIEGSTTRVRLSYLFPCLHTCACLLFTIGLIVPRWDFLLKGWVFLVFADFPISLVAITLGWHQQALGLACYFVAGTGWWYFLGRVAEKYRSYPKNDEQVRFRYKH